MKRRILTAMLIAILPAAAMAADRWTFGLSTSGGAMTAIVIPGATDRSPTVVLLGGLQGHDASSDAVVRETTAYEQRPQRQRPFRLIAIADGNPEGQPLEFPPAGVAYREHVEAHVLWRWLGTHAPDLVLIAGPDSGLADALAKNAVADMGQIPAQVVDPAKRILASLTGSAPSPAHLEMDRRLARSPRAFAEQLAASGYGRAFDSTYISAMAVISRLRLGQQADVAALLAPFLDGTRDSFARPSQSSLASHLLFFEFAQRTGDARAKALVLRAASSGFTETGELRESMPLNGGWSDSLFMDVPILAKAGTLSGDRRYFDMAARHIAFMQPIVLRPDGLYRHQASTDAAWGRGNAFPALGMALTLSDFPKDHPAYPQLLASFRAHMAALARFQDENGMWRNVIDRPGAYPEYSATAMIGAAMLRGIRNGWLDRATYQPLVDKAWQAILARTGTDGRLIDVAESTGTRGMSADDYLHRAAIFGRDDRGGGMAMFFATELAGL